MEADARRERPAAVRELRLNYDHTGPGERAADFPIADPANALPSVFPLATILGRFRVGWRSPQAQPRLFFSRR